MVPSAEMGDEEWIFLCIVNQLGMHFLQVIENLSINSLNN